jgi:hypothetical protein
MSLTAEELSEVRSVSGKNQQFWEARPELVTKLVELWETGLSTMKMATALSEFSGEPVSKNAVIGKVHRLGLVERIAPKPKLIRGADVISVLERGDCRWPIGHPKEPEFRFCREPVTSRKRDPNARGQPWPYCDKHYNQARKKPGAVDELE